MLLGSDRLGSMGLCVSYEETLELELEWKLATHRYELDDMFTCRRDM